MSDVWEIGELAEYIRKLYKEAGRGLWQPENKEYEEHNQAYIFRHIAVALLEKQKPIPLNSTNAYKRGYNTGYKAGKSTKRATPKLTKKEA